MAGEQLLLGDEIELEAAEIERGVGRLHRADVTAVRLDGGAGIDSRHRRPDRLQGGDLVGKPVQVQARDAHGLGAAGPVHDVAIQAVGVVSGALPDPNGGGTLAVDGPLPERGAEVLRLHVTGVAVQGGVILRVEDRLGGQGTLDVVAEVLKLPGQGPVRAGLGLQDDVVVAVQVQVLPEQLRVNAPRTLVIPAREHRAFQLDLGMNQRLGSHGMNDLAHPLVPGGEPLFVEAAIVVELGLRRAGYGHLVERRVMRTVTGVERRHRPMRPGQVLRPKRPRAGTILRAAGVRLVREAETVQGGFVLEHRDHHAQELLDDLLRAGRIHTVTEAPAAPRLLRPFGIGPTGEVVGRQQHVHHDVMLGRFIQHLDDRLGFLQGHLVFAHQSAGRPQLSPRTCILPVSNRQAFGARLGACRRAFISAMDATRVCCRSFTSYPARWTSAPSASARARGMNCSKVVFATAG